MVTYTTTAIGERRQRWAAFSVRAHRDLASLAADILLYDRIILPVPEDEPDSERWVRKQWNPDDLCAKFRVLTVCLNLRQCLWLYRTWAAAKTVFMKDGGPLASSLP